MIIKYYIKDKLLKETKLVNNPGVIPQLGWFVTIKSTTYIVDSINLLYENGFIKISLKTI